MAAPGPSGPDEYNPRVAMTSVPLGQRKDRRASIVIKETEQLLCGLHEDADRSEALMAELEALLAAAQNASGQLQETAGTDTAPMNNVGRVLQFAAVQPMQAEDSDDDNDTPVPAPRSPIIQSTSDKRRSTVVTFDGSSLSSSPGGPSGAAFPFRTPPTSRRSLQAARSFTESKTSGTLRRTAITDVGGRIVTGSQVHSQQYQQQNQQGGPLSPTAATMTSTAVAAAVPPHRPSNAETAEYATYVQSVRRSTGIMYGAMSSNVQLPYIQVSAAGASAWDESMDGGSAAADDLGAGYSSSGGGGGGGVGQDAGAIGAAARASTGGPAASQINGSSSRSGFNSGRFLKILLRGFFHENSSSPAEPSPGPKSSPPSITIPSTTGTRFLSTTSHPAAAAGTSAATAVNSAASIALESSLYHPGALSSMTVRATSRSQLMTRHGSYGAGGAGMHRASTGAPSPVLVARSASITSSSAASAASLCPHALVPTPAGCGSGSVPYQLRRQTSGSGFNAMAMAMMQPLSLAGSVTSSCLSPTSPSAILYGVMSPSSSAVPAVDSRLSVLPLGRLSLTSPTVLREQL